MHQMHGGAYAGRMSDTPAPAEGPDHDTDLDLRLVRYFTVVAECLNFGRAAERLRVAQPSLSRQMQRLEAHLGVRLLDRTSQGTGLTQAGEVFLEQARTLLSTTRRAISATRTAAPAGALTVGYVEDLAVSGAVRALRAAHPGARIRTRHLAWNETRAFTERRIDALVTRKPFTLPTADRLRVTVLYEEPRVLVVPATHPLAGKEHVSLDDVADEEFIPCTQSAALWTAPRPPEPRFGDPRDGAGPDPAVPPGPSGDDSFEDKLDLIAAGYSLGILPAGDRRSTLRPDVAVIPLEGMQPCQVVLVSHADDRNPLLPSFSTYWRHGPSRPVGQPVSTHHSATDQAR